MPNLGSGVYVFVAERLSKHSVVFLQEVGVVAFMRSLDQPLRAGKVVRGEYLGGMLKSKQITQTRTNRHIHT